MKEIGGYFELEKSHGSFIYDDAFLLNSARNALRYLIIHKSIKRIFLPYYICDAVIQVCLQEGISINYYSIGKDFYPNCEEVHDAYLYVVNYFGLINNDKLRMIVKRFKNVIVDNVQAFFQKPLKNADTLYSCRKFFGVSDGAVLFSDIDFAEQYPEDESYSRYVHLLGRYEKGASDFYEDYQKNEEELSKCGIRRMSMLTKNSLSGINYNYVRNVRTKNYEALHNRLGAVNELALCNIQGAFAYPFLVNHGASLRKKLIEYKIYVPILWPNVLGNCSNDMYEYYLADNLLPLPVDQRYSESEMNYIVDVIMKEL